jgi:hypothetical protein
MYPASGIVMVVFAGHGPTWTSYCGSGKFAATVSIEVDLVEGSVQQSREAVFVTLNLVVGA